MFTASIGRTSKGDDLGLLLHVLQRNFQGAGADKNLLKGKRQRVEQENEA